MSSPRYSEQIPELSSASTGSENGLAYHHDPATPDTDRYAFSEADFASSSYAGDLDQFQLDEYGNLAVPELPELSGYGANGILPPTTTQESNADGKVSCPATIDEYHEC